jgi:hypothetical protein
MARITDAIIDGAYAPENVKMLDLKNGGQHGYGPDLSNGQWISNQAYVRRNLICLLLEAPRFFQLMPKSDKWVEALKSLVEEHARTIEGLNAGLTVEVEEHPVGGGGEMQEEYTDVKRARSQPVFTFIEKYGLPIQTMLQKWITYGMMDPETKYALIGTLDGANSDEQGLEDGVPTDMLADWYTMSCLFIEPDPTHRRVLKAWVTTNMFPKSTGEIIGKRDLTAPGEINTLSVEFTGISQYNLGTIQFAQSILDKITFAKANPFLRPSFIQEIDANVSNVDDTGYREGIQDLAKNAVSE